jgi:uncharacterized membrane protein
MEPAMPAWQWLAVFQGPLDVVGAVVFVLVFPVYHGVYPWLMRVFPDRAAKVRFDRLRRSWIEGVLERRDYMVAVQQTRNLTMVNSLLASSSLILMGLSANLLISNPEAPRELLPGRPWEAAPGALEGKIFVLIVVFAVAFAYCMTSLRHLGHFNVVIGADPALLDELEGSSVAYLATLINRASNRYTLAVRCLYSAAPVFLWLFDPWFFLLLTLFWGAKFIFWQDFAHALRR